MAASPLDRFTSDSKISGALEVKREGVAVSAPHEPDELLTIGEMSRRTGVAPSALRYYEELGLVGAVRTAGNQRRYARHMLRRVSLVSVAKRLGMPLSDVQEAFGD
eukprot:Nk52_evm1s1681 gene=Nk52_evmTU1s1681